MSIKTTIEQQPTTTCIRKNENKKSRKRGRRVSFSESLEQVQVVENLRLTLTPIEKSMFWDVEVSSDFSVEEKSPEQVLFEAFVVSPSSNSSSSPKKNNKNNDKKRQRRKSRSQSVSIFGDFNQAPATPRAQKVEKSSTKKLSPLNSIRSRLGIRTGGKKSVTPLPLRD